MILQIIKLSDTMVIVKMLLTLSGKIDMLLEREKDIGYLY